MLLRGLQAAMQQQVSRMSHVARSFHVTRTNWTNSPLSEPLRTIFSPVAAATREQWSHQMSRSHQIGRQFCDMVQARRMGAKLRPVQFESFLSVARRAQWQQRAGRRFFSGHGRPQNIGRAARAERQRAKNKQIAMYLGGMTLFTISFTYASVPLYRIFCQKTGFAGTVKTENVDYGEKARPVSGKRLLTIKFNADVSETMPWRFVPQQHEIKVVPGEAALVFYKALNKTNQPIIGVASYNVQPEGAAAYFNKIQCFCFEEQMLGANEKIDMPVFFFIDPDFLNDKAMDSVETITLSYTFFKSGDANAPDIAGMLEPAHHPVYPRPQAA